MAIFGGSKMKIYPDKPQTPEQTEFIMRIGYYRFLSGDLTTAELREMMNLNIWADGSIIYGLRPSAWGDMPVPEWCINRLNPDGSVKTFREYLIVLADDGTNIICRLACMDENGNITPENALPHDKMELCAGLIGIDNIHNHNDAIAIRNSMMPEV